MRLEFVVETATSMYSSKYGKYTALISYLIYFCSQTFKSDAPNQCLVIIQCDAGYSNGDLIACARYRIYDLRAKADKGMVTHVLFIIYLPRQSVNSSFISFLGDPWVSSHIDDLRPTTDDTVISASEAIMLTISELFFGVSYAETVFKDTGKVEDEDGVSNKFSDKLSAQEASKKIPNESEVVQVDQIKQDAIQVQRPPLYRRLYGCIQAAVSRLKDVTIKRSIKRVKILVDLIPEEPPVYSELGD